MRTQNLKYPRPKSLVIAELTGDEALLVLQLLECFRNELWRLYGDEILAGLTESESAIDLTVDSPP